MNSEWVRTEIANARRREVTEKTRVLFPVRLVDFETIKNWTCFDADTGKDSAREIREYFIPNFSHWKDHDAYQRAFDRLLCDLKAADSKSESALDRDVDNTEDRGEVKSAVSSVLVQKAWRPYFPSAPQSPPGTTVSPHRRMQTCGC